MRQTILTTILFMMAFTVSAQSYQAPDIKISRHPDHSGQVIIKGDWESKYEVEQEVIPDRDVASEEDITPEKDRSPSSERKPSSKSKKPKVEPWPFDPSEAN
ncbi:hypothetical protein BIY24_12930 [Halobacteriovorax marinus]|uniref:hypothetical protein n=1 Tax=Halobacteriovorax marinus TaxID=97084 RepID=UPI000BC362F7|nr:hypothetical protein [Halobacteriovorax marinus]ATH08816.1 hypothetical protein BIY24_12930 [Halobacteriovorax marinus]